MRLRLGWKLGITYLVLIVLSVSVFGYFTMNFLEQGLLDERKAALFTHANILANSSAPYLRDSDQSRRLNSLARDFAERTGTRFLVLDKSGQVAADSVGEFNRRILRHREVLAALKGENAAAPYLEKEFGWVLYLAVPVTSGKQVIGAVFLAADINILVDRLDEIRQRLYWFSAVSGGVVFVISLFLGAFLTKPVQRLIEAARRISRGEYGYRVENPRNDEIGELTEVFNEMSGRIKEEDSIRRQFVADASHELRSPVASVKALLESWPAKKRGEDTDIAELLDDLRFEAGRLEKLVEDLLLLSRIEGNRQQFRPEETLVGELTEAVKRTVMPLAARKGIEVETVHGGNIYWQLDGDKIFRVLLNLADNAVKYSFEGGRVNIGFKVRGEKLVLWVSNIGGGIPAEEIPGIFRRFYRLDKARSRQTGGWGLGLAIVREIVDLHNGTINVSSEPGGETVFTVELPSINIKKM